MLKVYLAGGATKVVASLDEAQNIDDRAFIGKVYDNEPFVYKDGKWQWKGSP